MDAKFKFSSGNLLSILSAVVFACFLLYVFEIYNEESVSKGMFANEKDNIVNELKRTKSTLQISMAENTLLQSELLVQKQKTANLLDEINLSSVDISKIYDLKKEVNKFTAFVGRLTTENGLLRSEKANLKRQRDSLQAVINNARKNIDTLVVGNHSPHYLINDDGKIVVMNLKTIPVKQDNSGYFERTYAAKSVNCLKLSFMVVGNKIGQPCSKEFYIQIIDSKNNVVGKKSTKNFGNLELNYSFLSAVMFQNKTIEVATDLVLESAEKGLYIVNIFDGGLLTLNTSFVLI